MIIKTSNLLCNDSAEAWGKFKPATIQIRNVPRSSGKISTHRFTVTAYEHS
jgi:hypothetical protein